MLAQRYLATNATIGNQTQESSKPIKRETHQVIVRKYEYFNSKKTQKYGTKDKHQVGENMYQKLK